jgi:hypothetical protein
MPFDDPACFRLDHIPVRPIHWLWRPYLACGNPALLDGDPGAGKSLLTADLAARLTRGGRMPDGTWRRRKANVLFLNAEDALDDTLRPRLDAAGADLTRVFCLGGVQVGVADGAEMSFPGCFEALRRAVVAHEIELVVIDPMMAFFKPETAANSDQVMRVALAPLGSGEVLRPDAGAGQAAPRCGRPARAEGRPSSLAMVGSVSVCRVRAVPSSPQGVYEVCHAFAASLPRLLPIRAAAKACRPRGDSCFRGVGKGYRLRTGPRKHGTPGRRRLPFLGRNGDTPNGPIRPCRTAPNDADKGKADRPPSRAVSALRPWPAANPKR